MKTKYSEKETLYHLIILFVIKTTKLRIKKDEKICLRMQFLGE